MTSRSIDDIVMGAANAALKRAQDDEAPAQRLIVDMTRQILNGLNETTQPRPSRRASVPARWTTLRYAR